MRYLYDTRTGLFGKVPPPPEFRAWVGSLADQEVDVLSKRVDLATGEIVDYQPPPPTPDDADKTWAWDDTIKRWVATATLREVKREQAFRIKAAAKAEDQTDITIAGNVLNADAASRALLFQKVQIAQMAVADGQPFAVDWMLADETVVTLNANQVKAVVRAINAREDAIRAHAHTLLAAIKAATTSAEVGSIVWTWPPPP